MRRGFCLTFLLVGITLPALAAAKDDKPVAKDEKPAAKEDAEKWISLGQVAGQLTHMSSGDSGEYTIKVTSQVIEANPQGQADYARHQEDLLKRQVQIMRTTNPADRQKQMIELIREAQKAPGNLFKVREVSQDVKVVPADDMKVRLAYPPPAFDDKGFPKKYTAAELKELRGTENLPGYSGSLDDIKTNQIVLVTLARKAAKPDAPKDRDKDKALVGANENPLIIRMIIVLGEK
jgi:hypothetical protein